jgi:hypothetical protein
MFVLLHIPHLQIYRRGNCVGIVKYSDDDRRWNAEVYQCGQQWDDFVKRVATWHGKTVGQAVAPMHKILMEFADFPPQQQQWKFPHGTSVRA